MLTDQDNNNKAELKEEFKEQHFVDAEMLPLRTDVLPENVLDGGYLFPVVGGTVYNGLHYSQHALERMAPSTVDIVKLLNCRVLQRSGLQFDTNIFEDYKALKCSSLWLMRPQPRSVLPSVVESEISNPGSTPFRVIHNCNFIITVIPRN